MQSWQLLEALQTAGPATVESLSQSSWEELVSTWRESLADASRYRQVTAGVKTVWRVETER